MKVSEKVVKIKPGIW